ncbi:MAG: class I SAM-dependent RNA methyltransferase [Oscillospiraceae bacterium]|nr:class I SAM-dependent RNA methyltransferase [Oscillospiraceae bacterium]
MSKTYKLVCPCHFGLESVLSFEAKRIGADNVKADNGRVSFEGNADIIAKANICFSTAERVLIELGSFKVLSFEDLFQGVKSLALEEFIGRKNAFPVKGHSLNSKLSSVPACQSIVKKAAVERLKEKYSLNWLEETDSTVQISFSIMKDIATIYLDTSGIALHKRGYRRQSNLAPIKETLAAGIVDLARVRRESVVVDPFCGSGTVLIEAAFKAMNYAPGLKRSFAAEKWGCLPKRIWSDEREAALSRINKDCGFKAYGSDIDPSAIEIAKENARRAGVLSAIEFSTADIRSFSQREENEIVICNPPYGERLLDIRAAEEIYGVMGQRLKADADHPCYVITSSEGFEKNFGKEAKKCRKLYNGMMKCRLYMYF